MPHLHLEYSDNLKQLDVEKTLLRLNHTLVGSGQFAQELDIKARAQAFAQFRVGVAPVARAFACVRLALLSGRSSEVKQQLSSSLLEVLKEAVHDVSGLEVQLSVEVTDMDRDSYVKVLLPT
ncbi:5-carboxymethyl-2-hydroxymuconate Delta-isomerase [Pseudomonas sp. MAFF212428]|uniref:5-carboxymethyl-2-hydroxymuconate Delta-isomerase n=1 Tax=Pseudomonas brassicae TaxID=2708063 RepID=A0A6B3NYG4_9PSED|nr:5-carboxymethyl-2-hydroxymuconate Delta-isomerase [Pseudomonas brassicae]NER61901.1 5-carboxymethyl-2-hydroxymuconate Delta-isomerase [Pseudomonas brassicae]NER64524.1 5-carboxymethyl-2-hydroxymuconate Delta-isomerase [Pseudomonas brassicae]